MATITKRGKKWRALVRRKGFPTQTATFERKAEAERWAASVEADIYAGRIGKKKEASELTLGEILACHLECHVRELKLARWQGRPSYMNELEYYFGTDTPIEEVITPKALEGYARYKLSKGVDPSSTRVDLSHLSSAITTATLHLDLPTTFAGAYRACITHLSRMRLIMASRKREQRVSDEQIEAICRYLDTTRFKLPMRELCYFAVATAMRVSEICRIRWEDFDEEGQVVLIRDRKHPSNKKGNHQLVPLSARAMEILSRVPRTDERIFPYLPSSVGRCFMAGRDGAGVKDIRFHDLRHEGVSRLFEEGFQIQEVALVSGHTDWKNLKRYTNLRPQDLAKRL